MNIVFYELEHGVSTNHFLFERNTNHSFPLHMHRCYEMVLMLDGEMSMQIDKDEYLLHAGDLILVKPNRVHSYRTDSGKKSTCLLCVFSGDLISAINEPLTRYRLRSTVIHGISALHRDLFASMQENSDLATIKGFLYLFCAFFYRELNEEFEDVFGEDSDLLQNMFAYIENHVDRPCTLHELARELKYNESYLSRMFMCHVGIPFSEYVRSIKINNACYLLRNTSNSVCDVSMKCGYATQSSFNRSFKQLVGMSPSEYRIKNNEGSEDS